MVANRLKSIGVINHESDGICSIKNMALAQSRFIFENITDISGVLLSIIFNVLSS